ncbi:MAG TPA: hypothetical protein VFS23_14040, partial [Vicinamibacterales bacterium]|nr:hypothetical protein [Vicinamibacterales bacterium]
YKQKGHTIELVGTEEIDGRPMHHVKLTKKNGRVQHHYFDAKDGLERRIVVTIEQGPIKGEMRTELSDYRDVDGINVPFAMRRTINGKPGPRVDLDKVEFNVPIDDATFGPPQK